MVIERQIIMEEIEYKRVNNDTWICNQLEELVAKYEKDIKMLNEESNKYSGDETIDGIVSGMEVIIKDLKDLLYNK